MFHPLDVKRIIRPAMLAAVLAVLLLLKFSPVLVGGQSLYARDLYNFHYPLWECTAKSMQACHLPLWNPLSQFGQNIAGNPNYLLYYPLAWVRAWMEPLRAMNVFIVLHLFLGGLAVACLFLRWRMGRIPSLCGGLLYAFSGVTLSMTCILNLMPYVFLAPAVLLALEGVLTKRRSFRAHILLAVAVAAVLTVFEPILVTGLMALCGARLLAGMISNRSKGSCRQILLGVAGAAAFGVVLAGPILIEGYKLLGRTVRGERLAAGDSFYSQPPWLTHSLWVPNPGGLNFGLTVNFPGERYTPGRYPYLFSTYLGLSSICLMFFAFWGPRRRLAALLLLGALVFLILAWGAHLPLLGGMLKQLPVLKWGRYTQKYMFFVQGSLLALIVLGLQHLGLHVRPLFLGRWRRFALLGTAVGVILAAAWLIPGSSGRSIFPIPVICLLGILGLAWGSDRSSHWRRWAGGLAGLLLLVDLAAGNQFVTPTVDRHFFNDPVPVLAAIQEREHGGHDFRVVVESPPPDLTIYGRTDQDIWISLYFRQAGYPLTGFTTGTRYAFNDSFDRSELAVMAELRNVFEKRPLKERIAWMQRAGIRYLITTRAYAHPQLEFLGSFPNGSNYPSALYEVRQSENRIGVTERFTIVFGDERPEDLWLNGEPHETFLHPVGPLRGEGATARPRREEDGTLSLADDGDSLRISASRHRGGLLVVRDAYYPGWKAFLDGREVPVHQVDAIFRGVILPSGDHEVAFRYRPTELVISSWLSGIGILLAIGGVAMPRRLWCRLFPHGLRSADPRSS